MDGGYNSGNCGASGRRNWKDLKRKQAGEETTQRFMADYLSNGEVGEDNKLVFRPGGMNSWFLYEFRVCLMGSISANIAIIY